MDDKIRERLDAVQEELGDIKEKSEHTAFNAEEAIAKLKDQLVGIKNSVESIPSHCLGNEMQTHINSMLKSTFTMFLSMIEDLYERHFHAQEFQFKVVDAVHNLYKELGELRNQIAGVWNKPVNEVDADTYNANGNYVNPRLNGDM